MEYPSRFHNVFFSYRGPAAGGGELTPGNQLEDNLTRALVVTLHTAGAPAHALFLADLCDVADSERLIAAGASVRLQPLPDEGREPAAIQVLLGISPAARIEPGTLVQDTGGSRADAALEFGRDALVIIESKAVGGCDGGQLARHAHSWGIAQAVRGEPPASWRMVSWQQVADWARAAQDRETDAVARFLLGQLADYLDLAQATRRSGVRVAAPARVALTEELPPWFEDLATSTELDRVAGVCAKLYGDPASDHHVCGDKQETPNDCRVDSRRVREAYEAARERTPGWLGKNGGNVITARRVLSILYGPNRYQRSVADMEVGALIGVGVDRAGLLGMLAWAWGEQGVYAASIRALIADTWERAPVRSLAAPELHEALGPRNGLTPT